MLGGVFGSGGVLAFYSPHFTKHCGGTVRLSVP